MSSLRAIFRGLSQALACPGLVLFLWLVNLAVAVPAGLWVAESLRADLGASAREETLRQGFDMDWYSEFEDRSRGLAATLEPSKVVGAGPFLDNLEAWASGDLFRRHPGLVGLGVFYALLWAVLLGGVLERFARPSQLWSTARLLEACGNFAGRMVRLALIAAPLYYLLFRSSGWLLGRVAEGGREAVAETPVLIAAVSATAATAVALVALRTVFDYARIILVTEERRSSLGAVLAGAHFVLRHPIKCAGIQGGFLVLGLLPVTAFGLWGPGTGQRTVFAIVLALLAGQAVLLSRLFLRMSLLSGQMAAYRFEERR